MSSLFKNNFFCKFPFFRISNEMSLSSPAENIIKELEAQQSQLEKVFVVNYSYRCAC